MPSIFGSTLYSILLFSFKFKKLEIFFSKFTKSSLLNAFDKESIFIRCLCLKKNFDGFKPTELDGESLLFKNLYSLSKSKISFLSLSYSESEIFGSLFS